MRKPGAQISRHLLFNTPDGASSPAPIGPGGAYTFDVAAAPGAHLSFATMFVPLAVMTAGTPVELAFAMQ